MNRKMFLAAIAGFCLTSLGLAGDTKGNLSSVDKQFMKMAAVADMKEAHIGEMAENQAAAQDVKDFGATLVKDHTEAYQELSALAAKTGVEIPKGINAAKDSEVVPLEALKGKRFDRKFTLDEVQAHSQAIAAFKREADHGQNADVRGYASKMLPTLQEHLRRAEDLEKNSKHS